MASINDLSTEVLLMILKRSCLHCKGEFRKVWDTPPLKQRTDTQLVVEKSWYSLDQQVLYNLCLVSKRLREVAQALLHHEFVLGYGDSWRSKKFSWEGRLVAFMRTVSQRRDLASLVHAIYIHPRLMPIDKDLPTLPPALEEAGRSLSLDLKDVWKQRRSDLSWELLFYPDKGFDGFIATFTGGDADGLEPKSLEPLKDIYNQLNVAKWAGAEMIAMLIALLPNLEYISLHHDDSRWPEYGFPKNALSAMGVSHRPIKRLDFGPFCYPILHIAKDLEELNIHGIYGILRDKTPDMPNLKTLRITDCDLTTRGLTTLISSCTGDLRTFAYECGQPRTPPPRGLRYQSHREQNLPGHSDILNQLKDHRNTLQSVHIDLVRRRFGPDASKTFPTLRDFVVLQHLFVDSMAVYRDDGIRYVYPDPENDDTSWEVESDQPRPKSFAEVLPASLESLIIRTCTLYGRVRPDNLGECLREVLNFKKNEPDRLPNLRIVRCDMGSVRHMSYSFEAVGVDFSTEVWLLSEVKPYLVPPLDGVVRGLNR